MSAVLRKTTAPIVTVHFRNVCFGRGSFIHASQALRPEKRGSPLPMGRTGTDFIPLTLQHCVRTRPAGNKVRLRLDFLDARFILSGSVVHFAPDTSSEGERKRKTVTAGVPLLSTPSATDLQSGIATLSLRSICAAPIRSRGFSSYAATAGFPLSLPSQYCLVSLNRSNPSDSTPSLKPLPPARLTRPKCVITSP